MSEDRESPFKSNGAAPRAFVDRIIETQRKNGVDENEIARVLEAYDNRSAPDYLVLQAIFDQSAYNLAVMSVLLALEEGRSAIEELREAHALLRDVTESSQFLLEGFAKRSVSILGIDARSDAEK